MTTKPGLLMLGAVALLIAPFTAEARCFGTGSTPGTCANGCAGIRTCDSGVLTCECLPPRQPCKVCNRDSFKDDTGACMPLPETCNNCDDDLDGVADDGLVCSGTGPFTPKCSSTEPIFFDLGSLGAQLPFSVTNPGQYANNINYAARIFTNPLVQNLSLYYDFRQVEVFDTFTTFNPANGQLKDEHGADNTPSFYALSGQGQVKGIDLNFSTDATGGAVGFRVNVGLVTCAAANSTASAAEFTEDGRDTYGVLTRTDDVVFFQIPVPNEPFSIWLDGVAGAGKDADLYARYDELPERDKFDFSSRNTGHSEEWINIDEPEAGRTLFIAVHSRSGNGSFNIRMARVKPKHRWSQLPGSPGRPLLVGVNFTPNATERGRITTMLTGAQRFMVGASEGKIQLRNIELHTSTTDCSCNGSACDVCIHGAPGRASCVVGVTLTASNWNFSDPAVIFSRGSRVMVHELGHCLLGLEDEYRDHGDVLDLSCLHGDTKCSHSVMGGQTVTANFCSWFDHGRDTGPLGHVCSYCPLPVIYMLSGQACTVNNCNACFIGGKSDWETIVDNGDAYSAPTSTANHRTYESFRGIPFTVTQR